MEEEIGKIVKDNTLVKVNNFYLTNYQIEVLKKSGIEYESCSSLKEIIFECENILDEDDDEELEIILEQISENDYYQNTNK